MTLHWKRALLTWLGAYLTITAAGIGLYFLIAAVQHTGSYASPMQDPSYRLEEPFLPLANLLIWTAFALVYFGKRRDGPPGRLAESLRLGALWLALALPIDFLDSVAIKSPYSMSAHDFYAGQAPWIYLIYAAVFVSPVLAAALRSRPRGRRAAGASGRSLTRPSRI